MYSDERQSSRSPTTSRTDSYRDGPAPRTNGRGYQLRSTITEQTERDDNEYEEALEDDEQARIEPPPQRSEDQYIAALRYRFPNRPKSDYAYSKPPGPAVPSAPPLPTTTQPITRTTTTTTTTPAAATTTARSGPYQSLRPTTGATRTSDTPDDRTLPKPVLRRVTPDQQNTYARRVVGDTTTPPTSQPQPKIPGPTVRITEPAIDTDRPTTSTFSRQFSPSGAQESIFEKVPSHGPVSYLGTATFSQFEHCLRECLERERRMTGIASHITRHDIPGPISAHDYDYDYDRIPTSSLYHDGLNPMTVHTFTDYPSRPTSTFSIDDVRYINVALSRNGIPLFPYYRSYDDSYPSSIPSPHTIIASPYPSGRHGFGEVVSACQVAEEDPAIVFNRSGIRAVQNVWNAIQNHGPFLHIDRSRSISPRGLYSI